MLSIPVFEQPDSVEHARAIQDDLRNKLIIKDSFSSAEVVAGIDVGYDNQRGLAHASLVVMRFNDLKPIIQRQVYVPVDFPYIPGLLAFREIPALFEVLSTLDIIPDIIMVDGHGIAHPKRMGIAAHLGVLLDTPTIGVAKSRLTGYYAMPGSKKGSMSALVAAKNERIGMVLRSRDNVAPLFISPGHRISINTSVSFVQRCLTRYRLPEPTRLADKYSKCK